MVIVTMRICVYVIAVVEGIYTCKTWNFGIKLLCLCMCFWRVCTHGRLPILAASLCVHVIVVVEGMYTYEFDDCGTWPLC